MITTASCHTVITIKGYCKDAEHVIHVLCQQLMCFGPAVFHCNEEEADVKVFQVLNIASKQDSIALWLRQRLQRPCIVGGR